MYLPRRSRREGRPRERGPPLHPAARVNYVRAWLNETNPILDQMREEEGLGPPPQWSLWSWLQFLWERAPPLVFGLLASGPCLSGLYLTAGHIPKEKFVWAMFGELVLLLLIRLMDDVKDYYKDKVVHPDRPLPRGLIKLSEAIKVIYYTIFALIIFGFLMIARFSFVVGFLFIFQVGYTYLMYSEFGCGQRLERSPIIYGLVHQVPLFIGSYFICVLGGAPLFSARPLLLGSVGFSGFFTYEICRKLDPTLPRIKGTYLVIYGKQPTTIFVLCTIFVGVVGSYLLNMHYMLWPFEGVMVASVLLLMSVSHAPGTVRQQHNPPYHKPVEFIAVIYLLVHMWSGFLKRS